MKIIDKIKKLLNRTVANGCTEEEAKTSFILARKLMIKHHISENELKDMDEQDIVKMELSYDCNVYWIFSLLKIFLNNFGIMNFMINKDKELHCVLFGIKVNVNCVETLMRCAYNYLEESSEKYIKEYEEIFGIKDEKVKLSYKTGFIRGLSDKYAEQNKLLTKDEALMIIPDSRVQDEFEKFTKDFEQQEIEYVENSKNDDELFAMQAGYNEGRIFGSTALTEG